MLARIASLYPARLIFRKRDFSSEIFISRLSYYTTDKELSDAFSAFGTIKSARIIRDPRTNRPKGFGFVNYATELEAQKAVKAMDGRIFRGRLIFVEIAKRKPPCEGG
ncbi:small RNA-binding protein 11, chloroplastic [Dendrobium catenatum]|uniref:Glycine-rich RNA-binding protein 4, mitochondrial n=1 Tax=Dendrobium catenatum TaxID=906689 RepID=A0A2I0X4L8_9ASPA|nr:small RNA-binding protein 11, chloroplastic [Dendrobium catenatum]PKU82855.1 Glycine-rich RNA-binding protein 4, mitochondrial [Dendrobium catenatum]